MNDAAKAQEVDRGVSRRGAAPSQTGAGEANQKAALWRKHLAVFFGLLAIVLALFQETFWSMVTTWWRSETFAHGFIVVPISAYLAYRKWPTLKALWPSADPRALLLLVLLGIGWLFGDAADVLGVTQLTATAMIPVLVMLIFGIRVAWALVFPLAFLFLAVPIGEFLVPPLIDFTASFTVHALQLTGVPVYWEGNRFTLPSGEWSVIKACSGVRYLYATLTVALLYVYLNYRTRWRQVLFVLIAVVLSILANGLRAYGIVMIGHLSEMRLAVGVDHFIYGWVFFALLMVILFWLGGFLREKDQPDAKRTDEKAARRDNGAGSSVSKAVIAAVAGFAVLAVFPGWAHYVEARPVDTELASLNLTGIDQGWSRAPVAFTDWEPIYVNPSSTISAQFVRDGAQVGLYVAFYGAQRQGSELINFQNVLVKEKGSWHIVGKTSRKVEISNEQIQVKERRLRSGVQDLLVWQWYWVNGKHLGSVYRVKLNEAWDKLFTGVRRGAGIVIYTPIQDNRSEAERRLRAFASDIAAPVDAALTRASADGE